MKKNLPEVTVTKGVQHNEQQLSIGFTFNKELITLVRTIYGARWSASKKIWYVLNHPKNLRAIFSAFKGKAIVDASQIFDSAEKTQKVKPNRIKETKARPNIEISQEFILFMKRRRYSENSIKTYRSFLLDFARFIHPLQLASVTQNHLKRYMNYLITER